MAVTKTTIDAAHCPSRLIQTCQIIAQPVTAGGFKGPNQSDNVSFSEFFYESIEHGLKAHRQLCSKSQQYSREETWWTVHPLLGHCLITLFLSDVGGQASDHQFVLIIRSAMKGTEVHQLGNLRMPWWRRCLVCMMKPGDMMVTLQHPLSGCRLHYISPPRAGGVLSAQLLQLDSKMVMTKFKFGVGYLPRHDMDRSSTFENVLANDLEEAQNMPFYQTLLSMLGEIQSIYGRVHKYCGGLDCNDQNSRAILREIQDNDGDRIEICFHVAHLLPHLSHDLVYVSINNQTISTPTLHCTFFTCASRLIERDTWEMILSWCFSETRSIFSLILNQSEASRSRQ